MRKLYKLMMLCLYLILTLLVMMTIIIVAHAFIPYIRAYVEVCNGGMRFV